MWFWRYNRSCNATEIQAKQILQRSMEEDPTTATTIFSRVLNFRDVVIELQLKNISATVKESEEIFFLFESVQPSNKIQPFYIKICVESVHIDFQVGTDAVHAIISEKLYIRHFSKLKLCHNELPLKDDWDYSSSPLVKLKLNVTCNNKHIVLYTFIVENDGPLPLDRNC